MKKQNKTGDPKMRAVKGNWISVIFKVRVLFLPGESGIQGTQEQIRPCRCLQVPSSWAQKFVSRVFHSSL